MKDFDCFSCFESLSDCKCDNRETYSTEKPVCPNCGHTENDDDPNSDYYEDGDFEIECTKCRKVYECETSVSYSYTSRPLNEYLERDL